MNERSVLLLAVVTLVLGQQPGTDDCSGWIKTLRHARGRVFSQGHQDGILQAIFQRIGTTNRHCVEFGFGYVEENVTGFELLRRNSGLNTRFLLERQGWNATFFDAIVSDPVINVRRAVLTEDNIVASFAAAQIPLDVDYVSIDVDSVDLWLLQALLAGGYRPRVISAEYNANFNASQPVSCGRRWHAWNRTSVFGASAAALNLVAEKFGYRAPPRARMCDAHARARPLPDRAFVACRPRPRCAHGHAPARHLLRSERPRRELQAVEPPVLWGGGRRPHSTSDARLLRRVGAAPAGGRSSRAAGAASRGAGEGGRARARAEPLLSERRAGAQGLQTAEPLQRLGNGHMRPVRRRRLFVGGVTSERASERAASE